MQNLTVELDKWFEDFTEFAVKFSADVLRELHGKAKEGRHKGMSSEVPEYQTKCLYCKCDVTKLPEYYSVITFEHPTYAVSICPECMKPRRNLYPPDDWSRGEEGVKLIKNEIKPTKQFEKEGKE